MEKWKQDLIDKREAEICPKCDGIPKPSVYKGSVQTGPDLPCERCGGQLIVRTTRAKEKDDLEEKKRRLN